MSETLKIGFDGKRIVRNATGLGSYGRTLVNDLAAMGGMELFLYAPDSGRDDLREQVPEGDSLHFCYPQGMQLLGGSYWRTKAITKQLTNDGIQLFHGLSGELPMGLSKTGIKSVVTIHDLIFLRHPEYYNPTDVKIYTRKFHHAISEADRIVAISECTRRDICQLGDIDPQRVELIYQSCATRFSLEPETRLMWYVRDKYEIPDRYVLNVGSIEERKNILLAVKALHRLPDDLSLVVVGKATDYTDEVWEYVNHNGLRDRVVMLHDVPDDHLPPLYRMAEAFVYPSRYEGFGIPVIEAIRMGLPVVACTGSCLEEAGGPDSLYVNPDDDEAMAHAIAQVLIDAPGREQRIEKGKTYIKRFENSNAARQFADLYHELLS